MNSPSLIQFKEVCYSYPDGSHALRDINISIEKGDSLAIIGANGAGKSTFLMHFNGILSPSKGSLILEGTPFSQLKTNEIRKRVGMVFQNPDDQIIMPVVYEDVAFGPANMGLPAEEVERRVLNSMEQTGISHLRDKVPYRLSGGEKRAVSIAGVLAMEPEILVMDEPGSSLDARSRRVLIELLKQFRHTKIIATHDLRLVREVCSRTVILKEGRIAADGKTEAVLNDSELLKDCFLEIY